jgi:hypothetical protein
VTDTDDRRFRAYPVQTGEQIATEYPDLRGCVRPRVLYADTAGSIQPGDIEGEVEAAFIPIGAEVRGWIVTRDEIREWHVEPLPFDMNASPWPADTDRLAAGRLLEAEVLGPRYAQMAREGYAEHGHGLVVLSIRETGEEAQYVPYDAAFGTVVLCVETHVRLQAYDPESQYVLQIIQQAGRVDDDSILGSYTFTLTGERVLATEDETAEADRDLIALRDSWYCDVARQGYAKHGRGLIVVNTVEDATYYVPYAVFAQIMTDAGPADMPPDDFIKHGDALRDLVTTYDPEREYILRITRRGPTGIIIALYRPNL